MQRLLRALTCGLHEPRMCAETPLGAIVLGTTPLHGCWPALQATPAAATQLCPHEPLLATPALLLCAHILLVCLTHLSPLTTVAVLALCSDSKPLAYKPIVWMAI